MGVHDMIDEDTGGSATRRDSLSERAQYVMESIAPQYSSNDLVCGVGMAWRRGQLSFLLQVESPDDLGRVQGQIGSRVSYATFQCSPK
jgi:hypothetical protein